MTSMRSDEILKSTSFNQISPKTHLSSQFYMLAHHHERMLAAAIEFGWWQAVESFKSENGLVRFESALEDHLHDTYDHPDYPRPLKVKYYPISSHPIPFHHPRLLTNLVILYKLRVLMDHEGTLNVTSTPTPPVPLVKLFPRDLSQLLPTDKLPSWRIFLSSQRVTPNQYTTHKTTNRAVYDNVRAGLPNPTEGSIPSEVLLVNIHHQVMEGSITTPYFLRGKRWVTPPAAHGGNVGTTRRWALENGLCVEEEVPVDSLVPGECIWLSNGVRGWGWGYLEAQGLPDSSSSNVAGRSEG